MRKFINLATLVWWPNLLSEFIGTNDKYKLVPCFGHQLHFFPMTEIILVLQSDKPSKTVHRRAQHPLLLTQVVSFTYSMHYLSSYSYFFAWLKVSVGRTFENLTQNAFFYLNNYWSDWLETCTNNVQCHFKSLWTETIGFCPVCTFLNMFKNSRHPKCVACFHFWTKCGTSLSYIIKQINLQLNNQYWVTTFL